MKKILIVFLVILVILIAALFAAPYFFKDDIKSAVDDEIANNVNAEVYFDPDKIDIGLFKNFPHLTLTLKDFGVVGVEEFAGDTLTDIEAFEISIDLKSVISGDKIIINAVNLVNPRIFVLVTADGKANYDIAIPGEETVEESSEPSGELALSVKNWSISNGKVVYYDLSMDFLMALDGINHSGSGDFTLDLFDLKTSTVIERMMVNHENIAYLKNKRLQADIILNMDLNAGRYEFKENKISLNDFSFAFDGYVSMPDEDIEMDITFESVDNSIKSLFSMVPGTFKEGYENIKAEGSLSFGGFVKGKYREDPSQLPAFNFFLKAENGMIQYPDLPESLRNINVDLLIENREGIIDNTIVDLKSFHIDFGNNPIDANLMIKNLVDYDMEATVKAKIDLDDILRMFPMENTELSGLIEGNLAVNGVFDTLTNTIPAKGVLAIENLKYVSDLLPQGFGIDQSSVDISTTRIDVNSFKGNVGKTDLNLNGYLSNYIKYVFEEEEVLKGNFRFRSSMVDLNEWMTSSEDSISVSDTDSSALEVIEIPKNIDFILNSEIARVNYDNLELENLRGLIIVRNGIVKMQDIAFSTLDGDFLIGGEYNTSDMEHPGFDFDLKINQLSIPQAYQSFISVQKLAPIAELMAGKFSTEFKIKGELQQDMMPNLATLSGEGLLNIVKATIKGADSKVISGITTLTKLSGQSSNVTLSDVIMSAQIIDGRVYLEPFNVSFGSNKALIAGSNGLDGSLDYKLKIDVPQEAISTASSLVSSFTGKQLNIDAQNVKLNLGVAGNYNDPQIKILGAETGASSDRAKQELKANVEAEKEKLKANVEAEKEKLKADAEKKLAEEQEKAEEELNEIVDEQKEELEKEVEKAKDKLNKFFKKKKKGGK